MYINDFNSFLSNEAKYNNEKHFCKYCLQCFNSEIKWQTKIKMKKQFKQLSVALKIYADFESYSEAVRGSDRNNNGSYTEKYQCYLQFYSVCINDRFSSPVVLYKGKNAVNTFIEAILKEYDYCKSVKKAF